MSQIDLMWEDIRSEWERPGQTEVQVLEYIQRPDHQTLIAFYRVTYTGTSYSQTRIRLSFSGGGGGYDQKVSSVGDILETRRV